MVHLGSVEKTPAFGPAEANCHKDPCQDLDSEVANGTSSALPVPSSDDVDVDHHAPVTPHVESADASGHIHLSHGSTSEVVNGTSSALPVPSSHDVGVDHHAPVTPYVEPADANDHEDLSQGLDSGIHVQGLEEKACRRGKADYQKKHACFFCGKLDTKIHRHICVKHKNESEVACLSPPFALKENSLAPEEKDKLDNRRKMLDKFRILGDFNHNVQVLRARSGLLIVGRRSPGHDPDSYLPCKYCMVFYVGDNLRRHVRHCKQRKVDDQACEEMTSTFKLEGRMILSGAGLYDQTEIEHQFRTDVLEGMYQDEVSSLIKKDSLMLKFGSTLYNKLGKERAQDIRGRLPNSARLLIELNNHQPENSKKFMTHYLKPTEFDNIIAAVRKLCCMTYEEQTLSGQASFKKPSLVLKLGENLKKLAYLKRGKAIREQDKIMQEEAVDYLDLHTSE